MGPCKVGSYVCDSQGRTVDPTGFGVNNVTDNFVPSIPSKDCTNSLQYACGQYANKSTECNECVYKNMWWLGRKCQDVDAFDFCPSYWEACNGFHSGPPWACWLSNIPRKTGGWWFSTLKQGHCHKKSAPDSCSWKSLARKTIKERCLSNVLVSTVEAHDKSGCFQKCGPRNETSSCWISCFFDTLLGKNARYSVKKPLGGMPAAEIAKGWTNAFLPQEEGGCEEVEIPFSWESGPQLVV